MWVLSQGRNKWLNIGWKKLIKGLKDNAFLSNHFISLLELINSMPILHCIEVQLSALEWFLTENNVQVIIDKYFERLMNKNEKS